MHTLFKPQYVVDENGKTIINKKGTLTRPFSVL
jgi:hypothetical protein